MPIYINDPCDKCIHQHKELFDGWLMACDAFPNGLPLEHIYPDLEKLKECNNGIGFEPREKEKTDE